MVEIATPTPTAGFNADWASPPADLIEVVRGEFGWTRAELTQRLDFSSTRPRAQRAADVLEQQQQVQRIGG